MKSMMIAVLVAAGLFMGAVAQDAKADPKADATAKVTVQVVPNVALNVVSVPTASALQTGKFKLSALFKCESNSQTVTFSVCATDLYKEGNPSSSWFIPKTGEVQLNNLTGGTPEGDADNQLSLTNDANDLLIEDKLLPAMETETVEYGSGTLGVFDDTMEVCVWYENIDNKLPIGEYQGGIQLKACVGPEDNIEFPES